MTREEFIKQSKIEAFIKRLDELNQKREEHIKCIKEMPIEKLAESRLYIEDEEGKSICYTDGDAFSQKWFAYQEKNFYEQAKEYEIEWLKQEYSDKDDIDIRK